MLLRGAFFSAGLILLYCVGELPPVVYATALSLILLTISTLFTKRRLVAALGAGAGMLWLIGNVTPSALLDSSSAQREYSLDVAGVLCSLPEPVDDQRVAFLFCPELSSTVLSEVLSPLLSGRLALSAPRDFISTLPSPAVSFRVRIGRPIASANPNVSSTERQWFRQRVSASGKVIAVLGEAPPCRVRCHVFNVRQAVLDHLAQTVPESPGRAMAAALLVGYRGELSDPQWQVFRATGTNHLVAISGLHVGAVAAVVMVLAGLILMMLASLGWRPAAGPMARRRLQALVALSAATLFSILAGFSIPTQRALIMLACAFWAMWRVRSASPWRYWCLALFFVLLVDPRAPLDGGLWLSFGAVAVLLLLFGHRYGKASGIMRFGGSQFGVALGLLPLLMAAGLPVSWTGPLANLIAIPVVSLLALPLLLFGEVMRFLWADLGEWVLRAGVAVLDSLWWFLELLAAQGASGALHWFSPLVLVVAGLLVILTLLPLAASVRLASGMTVALLAVFGMRSADPEVPSDWLGDVWVFDVGQGLAVLWHSPKGAVLYDTGPAYRGGGSAAARVLLPNLAALGIRRLDALVLSHGDSDHAGGAPEVMAELAIGHVFSGESARVAQLFGVSATACVNMPNVLAGASWQILDSDAPYRDVSNNASCVMKLLVGPWRILLTGDIAQDREWGLARRYGAALAADVLLVPHHGSAGSSLPLFIKEVNPSLAIVTAGFRNRFQHPRGEVLARYDALGIPTLNTALSGAVQIRFTEASLSVETYRTNAPFWLAPALPATVKILSGDSL